MHAALVVIILLCSQPTSTYHRCFSAAADSNSIDCSTCGSYSPLHTRDRAVSELRGSDLFSPAGQIHSYMQTTMFFLELKRMVLGGWWLYKPKRQRVRSIVTRNTVRASATYNAVRSIVTYNIDHDDLSELQRVSVVVTVQITPPADLSNPYGKNYATWKRLAEEAVSVTFLLIVCLFTYTQKCLLA